MFLGMVSLQAISGVVVQVFGPELGGHGFESCKNPHCSCSLAFFNLRKSQVLLVADKNPSSAGKKTKSFVPKQCFG
jgi:hypothetical protein